MQLPVIVDLSPEASLTFRREPWLGWFLHRPGNTNSDVDPGTYIIVLGLEFDGAPKTHVR